MLDRNSRKCQECSVIVRTEAVDILNTAAKEIPHFCRRAVSEPHPDDFRRVSHQERSLMEIRILRHDGQALLRSVLPHHTVGCSRKVNMPDMR